MPLTMVLTVSLIMYNSALLVVFIVYIQPTISISLSVEIHTDDMTLINAGRKQEREREMGYAARFGLLGNIMWRYI